MVIGVGCGGDDDDDGGDAGICEMCDRTKDCKDGLDCEEYFDVLTGIPVGKYCADSPHRMCD